MALASRNSVCATCRRRRNCIVGDSGGATPSGNALVFGVEVIGAGSGLARPPGAGQLIGILRSGLIRMDRINARGERHMLGLVLPGEPIGELLPTRANHILTAVVASRICRFRTDEKVDFLDYAPRLRQHLMHSFSVRLARLQTILWVRASLNVNARVAALLLMAARFMAPSPLPQGGMLLHFILPRQDAADLLSTTVESFCRALRCLESDGLIAIGDPHRFELRDPAGLEGLAALDSRYLDALFPPMRRGARSQRRPFETMCAPATSRGHTVARPLQITAGATDQTH